MWRNGATYGCCICLPWNTWGSCIVSLDSEKCLIIIKNWFAVVHPALGRPELLYFVDQRHVHRRIRFVRSRSWSHTQFLSCHCRVGSKWTLFWFWCAFSTSKKIEWQLESSCVIKTKNYESYISYHVILSYHVVSCYIISYSVVLYCAECFATNYESSSIHIL